VQHFVKLLKMREVVVALEEALAKEVD